MSVQGKSILIVEDDKTLREVMAEAFALHGAIPQVAENGERAFALVRANRFDAVVSDIQMPGGDGIELMKRIAQLPPPKPLCFLCTGHSGKSDSYNQLVEVIKVFEKPFRTKDMIAEIGQCLLKVAS